MAGYDKANWKTFEQLPNVILRDPRIRPLEKLIAFVVHRFQYGERTKGICFMSHAGFIDELGCSRRALLAALDNLATMNIVTWTTAKGSTCKYRLHVPSDWKLAALVMPPETPDAAAPDQKEVRLNKAGLPHGKPVKRVTRTKRTTEAKAAFAAAAAIANAEFTERKKREHDEEQEARFADQRSEEAAHSRHWLAVRHHKQSKKNLRALYLAPPKIRAA